MEIRNIVCDSNPLIIADWFCSNAQENGPNQQPTASFGLVL